MACLLAFNCSSWQPCWASSACTNTRMNLKDSACRQFEAHNVYLFAAHTWMPNCVYVPLPPHVCGNLLKRCTHTQRWHIWSSLLQLHTAMRFCICLCAATPHRYERAAHAHWEILKNCHNAATFRFLMQPNLSLSANACLCAWVCLCVSECMFVCVFVYVCLQHAAFIYAHSDVHEVDLSHCAS